MDVVFPSIFRRYLASAVDGLVVLALVLAVVYAVQGDGALGVLRVALLLVVVFGYEPLLTSRGCTAGQWLMGFRVRRDEEPAERIGVPAALVRYVVKGVLGFFSFFAISFTRRRRALHDMVAGSVAVDVRS
jgi:uncharacterized RDD family membrane protein YckC